MRRSYRPAEPQRGQSWARVMARMPARCQSSSRVSMTSRFPMPSAPAWALSAWICRPRSQLGRGSGAVLRVVFWAIPTQDRDWVFSPRFSIPIGFAVPFIVNPSIPTGFGSAWVVRSFGALSSIPSARTLAVGSRSMAATSTGHSGPGQQLQPSVWALRAAWPTRAVTRLARPPR